MGPRRRPRPRQRRRRIARCSRRPSTCSPTWACSPARCRPASSRRRRRPTRTPPTSTITSPADGATLQQRRADHDPARRRGRGGGGRRRRGLGRRRHHLAPGDGRETWSYTWTPDDTGRGDDPRPRGRRQRQPRARRRAAVTVTVGGAQLPVLDLPGRRPPTRPRTTTPARSKSASSSASDQRRHDHRRCASTRAPANAGTHVGHLWTRGRHPARRGAVRRTSRHGLAAGRVRRAGRDQRRHDLRRLLSLARRPLRRRPRLLHARAFDAPPLHAPRRGGNGVYNYGGGFPGVDAPRDSNYWADVVFTPATPAPPAVIADRAGRREHGRGARHQVTATFDEPLPPSSVTPRPSGCAPVRARSPPPSPTPARRAPRR